MQPSRQIVGPHLTAMDQCEAILRSVPQWFGIEDAVLRFASDTATLPTFAIQYGQRLEAFLTLLEHFPKAWEVHCIAVRGEARRSGNGKRLLEHAEAWLVSRGAEILQVKTIAMTKDHAPYAERGRSILRWASRRWISSPNCGHPIILACSW